MHDLIWPAAFLIVALTAILGVLGPARRALVLWGDSLASVGPGREAAARQAAVEAEERRHALEVRRGAIDAETEAARARLAAETARFEADAEAARRSLDDAVAARRQALAPEAARKALEGGPLEGGEWLAEAYAAYCERSYSGHVLPFGEWMQGFEGVPRG